MSQRSLLSIPSGVQCFFGDEARRRREIERTVVDVFRGWSYDEVVLPLFDFNEVFARGGGPTSGSGSGSGIYRFIGRDGEVMALRPDFTALAAKVVASRLGGLELPLRLFYTGEVLRYQPPRAGQQEELFQLGLEQFGNGVEADVEVLAIALEALDRLGIEEARLTLGHVGVVLALLGEDASRDAVLDAMRRHDRADLSLALGSERAEILSRLSDLTGGAEVLEEAKRVATGGEGNPGLDRLTAIAARLDALGFSDRVRFDLAEVRGFDYYTGLVFEIHAPGAGLELGGGGRYDSLVGRFGRDLPAIGFYLSLDRLSELLAKTSSTAPRAEAPRLHGLEEALEARKRGERVKVTKP